MRSTFAACNWKCRCLVLVCLLIKGLQPAGALMEPMKPDAPVYRLVNLYPTGMTQAREQRQSSRCGRADR